MGNNRGVKASDMPASTGGSAGGNGGGGRGGAVAVAVGGNGGDGPGGAVGWGIGGGGGPPTFRVADYEYGVRNRHHAETDPPHRAGMTRKEAENWIKLFNLVGSGTPNPWRLIARPRGDWSEVTP